MSIPKTGRFILPDEKTPRRYGLLNVFFGSILIFSNLWMAFILLASALFGEASDFAEKAINAAIAKPRQGAIEHWKAVAASSKDPATRDLALERIKDMESRPADSINGATMGIDSLEDRRIQVYVGAEILSGLLLNGLMIVAGAGLIGLREWGRKLAIWLAAIKLVRLAVLTVVSILVIVPIQVASMSEEIPKIQAQFKGPPGKAATIMISPQWISAQGTAGVVLNSIGATIYPILLLVKLSRTRVMAACVDDAKSATKETSW